MSGKQVNCIRPVILAAGIAMMTIRCTAEDEIVFDDDGEAVWAVAGKMQKNGQRPVRLSRFRAIAAEARKTNTN